MRLILICSYILFTSSICIAENPSNTNLIPPLLPPAGQCALSKKNVKEAIIISRLEKKYAGKYHVLMVFVNCKELKALRQGKIQKIENYGEFLLPVKNQHQSDELEQSLPDPIQLNDLIKEVSENEVLA